MKIEEKNIGKRYRGGGFINYKEMEIWKCGTGVNGEKGRERERKIEVGDIGNKKNWQKKLDENDLLYSF